MQSLQNERERLEKDDGVFFPPLGEHELEEGSGLQVPLPDGDHQLPAVLGLGWTGCVRIGGFSDPGGHLVL